MAETHCERKDRQYSEAAADCEALETSVREFIHRNERSSQVNKSSDHQSNVPLKCQVDPQPRALGKVEETSETEELKSVEVPRESLSDTQTEHDEAIEKSESRSFVNEKSRKLSQRIRNKKVGIRRNPLRTAATARKESGRAPSARQRLLGARRRALAAAAAASAPAESSTSIRRSRAAPYMSTRSATRNLHTNRKPRSSRDSLLWKEWPVHGMHERPVYHPQLGLAAEYNGRVFASFDGQSYREIGSDLQSLEVVRVDPRLDSLDSPSSIPSRPPPTNLSLHRLGGAFKICGLNHAAQSLEQLHTSFNLAQQHQQIEQMRSLERLQQLEKLQMLSSRVRMQKAQNDLPNRSLSEDILKNLHKATIVRAAKMPCQQQSPSKYLLMPRPQSAPITLPFCNVQPFKSNPKGKLFFVRAPDAPKPLGSERTSTVTSSSQSSSVSWAELGLRKLNDTTSCGSPRVLAAKPNLEFGSQSGGGGVLWPEPGPRKLPEGPSSGSPQAYAAAKPGPGHWLAQPSPRAFVPHRQPEYQRNQLGLRKNTGFNTPEVLDLSKKEPPQLDPQLARMSSDPKASHHATDLVQYFQNFGADGSEDSFEGSKS